MFQNKIKSQTLSIAFNPKNTVIFPTGVDDARKSDSLENKDLNQDAEVNKSK
ncbi:hypothetical protein P872_22375 [Rhodonellum psychrophilum GCM71 = DSM 17998]|uniref:Uncharacterized protein n=1 Tax=Rhodonellum psychrophilum GCM71 = DSM 17998 TaxID=1123057 RepID=U5BU95_9BACT|nr:MULTISPECIES: hypothetical protein [Rhodonellum]ERM80161.1 hypothetical protein P872_22375 [Rhodonellum psychrophilum GCM71 = DSM 17998]